MPRAPLILGAAGHLPFAWEVAVRVWDALAASGAQPRSPRFVAYTPRCGTVVLSLLSDAISVCATRAAAPNAASWCMALRLPLTAGMVLCLLPR